MAPLRFLSALAALVVCTPALAQSPLAQPPRPADDQRPLSQSFFADGQRLLSQSFFADGQRPLSQPFFASAPAPGPIDGPFTGPNPPREAYGPADEDAPLRRRERLGADPFPAPSRVSRLAFWAGGRLGGELPIGDGFKDFGDRSFPERKLVGPGPALEIDLGARLGRRFVPFVFGQFLFASSGSASALPSPRPAPFTPPDTGAVPPEAASPAVDSSSAFALGLGFRYEFNPEGLGPAVEIAYAFRKTNVSFNTGQKLGAEAPGELRIGVGASWRVTDALTLSPLVTFAAGAYSDVVIAGFDGRERAVGAETPIHGYLGLSIGGHVDLFGKRLAKRARRATQRPRTRAARTTARRRRAQPEPPRTAGPAAPPIVIERR
jgi:hypothetical protein